MSTDLTASRLKLKSSPLTLRQAVESYNERVKFVQDSSSACVVSFERQLCRNGAHVFRLEMVYYYQKLPVFLAIFLP